MTEVTDIEAKIKLSEFFRLFAPTHILGTTYTISLAFFESVVFPFITKDNLNKCVIICDRIGFQRVFHGSFSLKSVLPAIIPEMSYYNLEIQEGQLASLEYLMMIDPSTPIKEKEKIKHFHPI